MLDIRFGNNTRNPSSNAIDNMPKRNFSSSDLHKNSNFSNNKKSLEKDVIVQWEKQLKPCLSHHIDLLVMDYLISEGFADEAYTFSQESSIALIDEEKLNQRSLIQESIKNGDIEAASQLLLEIDNEFMNKNPTIYADLMILKFIDLLREDAINKSKASKSPSSSSSSSSSSLVNSQAMIFAQTEFPVLVQAHPQVISQIEPFMSLLVLKGDELNSYLNDQSESLRNELAKRVNTAVLQADNRPSACRLERLLREMQQLQNELDDDDHIPKINI